MRRILLVILSVLLSESALAQLAVPDALPNVPRSQKNVIVPSDPLEAENDIFLQSGRAVGDFGIDVSHYQGNIDWKQVANDSRVSFVYIKATESSSLVDGTYRRNFDGAKSAGIPVGVYHFFSPTATVQQQLNNFFGNVDPKEQDLIPIVDVEAPPRNRVTDYVQRLRQFIDAVTDRFGCKPMIYTGPHFHQRYLAGNFTDCKFMFARYNQDVPTIGDKVRFVLWQFTASGNIKGIRGNVDRSQFMSPYKLRDIRYRGK